MIALNGLYTSPPDTSVLSIRTSGKPGRPITFRAGSGQKPEIHLRDNWGGISVDGASYLVIDGFTVVGNAQSITHAQARAQRNNLMNRRTIAGGIGVAPRYGEPSKRAHHVIIRNNTVS